MSDKSGSSAPRRPGRQALAAARLRQCKDGKQRDDGARPGLKPARGHPSPTLQRGRAGGRWRAASSAARRPGRRWRPWRRGGELRRFSRSQFAHLAMRWPLRPQAGRLRVRRGGRDRSSCRSTSKGPREQPSRAQPGAGEAKETSERRCRQAAAAAQHGASEAAPLPHCSLPPKMHCAAPSCREPPLQPARGQPSRPAAAEPGCPAQSTPSGLTGTPQAIKAARGHPAPARRPLQAP